MGDVLCKIPKNIDILMNAKNIVLNTGIFSCNIYIDLVVYCVAY